MHSNYSYGYDECFYRDCRFIENCCKNAKLVYQPILTRHSQSFKEWIENPREMKLVIGNN